MTHKKSIALLKKNEKWIPGGLASINRKADPCLAFSEAKGSRLWDVDGHEYIDYHAGFAPYVLGHGDSDVDKAVISSLKSGRSNYGSGPTEDEGVLAKLFLSCVPYADKVQFVNTGSEATAQAIRIARSATEKEHVLLVQGGYNGQHNVVSANLMTPKAALGGKQVKGGEYPLVPITAGTPKSEKKLMHAVEFNDLEAVEMVAKKYPLAAMILEPILQNIGIILPKKGYLAGLRKLANKYGFLLIFDEVKTGFRSLAGGYQSLAKVKPDLSTFGKAIANGYPMGALCGKAEYMDLAISENPKKRVLIAGTYNCHPVNVSAATACIQKLLDPKKKVYKKAGDLAEQLRSGIESILKKEGFEVVVLRQGSAVALYFCKKAPSNWWELLDSHDFDLDTRFRKALVERGIYVFPVATKQISVSYAHTKKDILATLKVIKEVAKKL